MRFGNLYMFAISPVRILFYKGVKGVPDRIPPLTMFAISRRGGKQPFHRLFGRIVFCESISGRDNATSRPFESCFDAI